MPSLPLIKRRQLLAGAVALPLSTCAPVVLAQTAPLKLALLTSLTGPYAALGESMRAGLVLLLEQSHYQMGGRRVELIVEDDHGKPDEALRTLRRLIERERIDVLCGVIAANIALALRDVVTDAKLPTFMANASANALARAAASPYIFRPTKTSWMLGHTGALWTHAHIAQQGGVTLAADYAAGREYIGDFIATFEQQGGRIRDSVWTPLGTADFAPIIMDLAAKQPEFIYAFLAGTDAVRFLQQMRDYGMQGKVPVIGPGALFDQEDVTIAAGEASLGGISTFHQSPGAPAAADFVRAYQAARGRLPGEASTAGYVAGQVIKAGVDALAGDMTQWSKFREVLLDEAVATAFGPLRFDARNNQAIMDIYVNEVRANAQGKPFNTVIHTYPGVQDPGPAA